MITELLSSLFSQNSVALYVALSVISVLYKVSWFLPHLLLKLIRWNMYKITDLQTIAVLRNLLNITGTYSVDEKEFGVFLGKWYFGYIKDGEWAQREYHTEVMYLYCSVKYYSKLINLRDGIDKKKPGSNITVYESIVKYRADVYTERKLKINIDKPTDTQAIVIDKIVDIFKAKNRAVVLINGAPSTGKSVISLLVALKLKANYCNDFNPFVPYKFLKSLYATSLSKKNKPLVICIDEIDTKIDLIMSDTYQPGTFRELTPQIYDKSSWNKFFDLIDRGLFPNLIVIMTTNASNDYFKKIDQSLLRNGRIDHIFTIEKDDTLQKIKSNLSCMNIANGKYE
jgi:hypothetical protein